MSTYSQSYAIEGGQAGKARLNVLAQVLEPTTLALFERVGIAPGMACLDVGSGGGDVTSLLAQGVGERGRMVGLDVDAEIVRLYGDPHRRWHWFRPHWRKPQFV